jgi:hypothetical protein
VISNRLSGDAFTLRSFNTASTWNAGANTTINDGGLTELSPNLNCRQLEISGNISNSISLSAIGGDASFSSSSALFIFALKVPNGGVATVTVEDASVIGVSSVYEFPITASSSSINAEGVASPQWSIIRVLTTPFTSNTPSLEITISVNKTLNEVIYFSSPVLVPQMEFIRENVALQYISGFLPQFMIEDDFTTVQPIDIPLHRFIDVATVGLDSAVTKALEISYIDKVSGLDASLSETQSTLVSPSIAGIPELLWLAKFVGTKPVTRFASSQETATDPFVLDSSLLDSADTIRVTSYSSLNPPAFDETAQKELLQWQVSTRNFGFNAGTTEAIEEAAKLMLVGEKTVSLSYDYTSQPFVIDIQTPWYETLGGDESLIGESSQLVLEAAAKAKPIGVLLTHTMTA